MNYNLAIIFLTSLALVSCEGKVKTTETESSTDTEFKNKAHELVYDMVQNVGTYQKLLDKKDLVYTYTYTTADNSTDQSTEKYIFDGEWSYGAYHKHQRTLPNLDGEIEQGYDGNTFWLKNKGAFIDDEDMLKRVKFNRKTNFYWFTMMQKLLDPGLNYKYIREEVLNGKNYDIVEVSFISEVSKPTDIYQLYINQTTKLVDQFLFTVMDFNVSEPNLMVLEYEKIDDLLIPTKRKYTKSNWKGEAIKDQWINVTWTDIKFNIGIDKSIFIKDRK